MQRLAGNNPASIRARPSLGGRARVSLRAGPLPRSWEWAVIALVSSFYMANIYDLELSEKLSYAKWLTLLPVIGLSWRAARRGGRESRVSLSPLPLVLISFVALLSVLNAL